MKPELSVVGIDLAKGSVSKVEMAVPYSFDLQGVISIYIHV
jgi:hypothetical protein